MSRHRAAALALLVAAISCATELPPQIVQRSCADAGVDEDGARCATLEVFENRSSKLGRKIKLNIVVLPALGPKAEPDPVFWLEGGPGAAATGAIGPVSDQYLAGIRGERDLVFVDQRGTGQSNPLRCDDIGERPANIDRYFGKLFPLDAIRACREKLEKVADLTQYTSSIAADDLDDVRAALGYEKVNLAGASYGSIAALVYMRQYPARVRSAYLVGVGTPGFRLPLPFPKATENALAKLFEDCAADQVCKTEFPNLRTEFAEVAARFDRGPLAVKLVDPASGETRTVQLERESYAERIRAMLYTTHGARFVPLVVHQAFLGNFIPFQTIGARFNPGNNAARGMYFSVTCAESAPFISEEEIVEATRGTFLGDRRVRAHLAACAEWPRATVPRSFLEPLVSDIPVTMYAGDADGSTPPWFAESAVKSLSNGRVILAPHTGHQIDRCTWELMQEFIRNPSAGQLDGTCAARSRRPAFATELATR